MPSPLSSNQSHFAPQHHSPTTSASNANTLLRSQHSLTPPPAASSTKKTASRPAVTLALPPSNSGSSNLDFSTPSSASSATTSFQQQVRSPLAADGAAGNHNRPPEDIEMDQMATPAGHRRRRSTLTSSAGGAGIPPPIGRGRAQSIRKSMDPGVDGKISEETFNQSGEGASKSEILDSRDSLSDEDLHDDEETGLTKKDKKRKRAKKRRNTRLDNRIARSKISDQERREADQNVARNLAINSVLIGLWYLFSLSISLVSPSCSGSSCPLSQGVATSVRICADVVVYSTTSGCSTQRT